MVELPDAFRRRRESSYERRLAFSSALARAGAVEFAGSSTCVYAVGSLARGDASSHSDVDAFIVVDDSAGGSIRDESGLRRALETSAAEQGFPPFTDEGKYLAPHRLSELLDHLGTPDDDAKNVLTARMLLLLESRPLVGPDVLDRIQRGVIDSYWRDFEEHQHTFLPVFLTNDITRFWRVLCLGYESKARMGGPAAIAKRRLDNYKLRHSRMLTYWSTLIWLCDVSRSGGTSPDDVMRCVAMTPIDRLVDVGARPGNERLPPYVEKILSLYAEFLTDTEAPRSELVTQFSDPTYYRERRARSHRFGDALFHLLQELSVESRLYRYLLI